MIKKVAGVLVFSMACLLSQNYQNLIEKFSDRLVVINFSISFEVRGEVVKRKGKTVGIIYDDSKVLTTSLTFEDEVTYSKRLRLLTSGMGAGFTNYKPPRTVDIVYNKKEISGELLLSSFEKGVAVIRAEKGAFPFKPLKFTEKGFNMGEDITIISLLPLEAFNFPFQLIRCSVSTMLKKQDDKFFQCDKPLGHISGGIVFNSTLEPAGILTTPISIPESIYDERDNFLAPYYGLNSVAILPYGDLKSFLGEGERKDFKLWIGLIPGTFSIYYEDKLKDIVKDGKYKVALNVEKIIPGSSLSDSKIFENDLIVEINGDKVENLPVKSDTDILVKIASLLKPLEFITFKVYRKAEEKYLDIKVVPKQQPVLWDGAPEVSIEEFGIKAKDLTVDYKLRRKLDLSEGGVAVTGGSSIQKEATNKGFSLEDIIKKVEKNTVNDIKQLKDIISKAKSEGKKTVSVEVMRGEDNEVWNLKIELK